MLRKLLQPFYTAWVLLTFTVSILALFPVFLLLSIRGTAAGRHAIFGLIRLWAGFWLTIIGMRVSIQGTMPQDQRYVIVANQISYLDTLNIFCAVKGYFRPLGKKEVSKIPVVGFIYKQIVILVDRSDVHSRARSLRLLWRVLHHEGHIIIFPEGTFNETGRPLKEFYDGAFRLAINTHTPVLPVLFPDTVARWHYSAWWKLWPGRNRAIYLEPVAAAGLQLQDLAALKNKVYAAMEAGLVQHAPAG